MRIAFADSIIEAFDKHPNLFFLTGDLGFMALEKVKVKLEKNFLNAGVAEQNMISIAAALAHEKFIPFAYSISPFITLRPYEQIRTDVCLHNLPVKIVGNGGGFGYGIMGSTHHNIEDIGAMRILPNMQVYVPLTADDVKEAVTQMIEDKHPNYLRLNLSVKKFVPTEPFKMWRKIKEGNKIVVIGVGPIIENLYELPTIILDELEIWAVGILPFKEFPEELLKSIRIKKKIFVIEEHQTQCGLHESIASYILQKQIAIDQYVCANAQGYISGHYGSQRWHQEENNLAGDGLLKQIQTLF